MPDKQLKDKAINLKGKKYVQVADRILYFNETYKNGCIRTRLLSTPEQTHYVVEAKVIPDTTATERYFSGLSQAKLGDPGANKDAALENAETSAVGRALAMMGIGVIDSVASSDEMAKAGVYTKSTPRAENGASGEMMCEYHKVKMFQSPRMKNPAHKDDERGWCNGQGYKDELDAWKNKVKEEPQEEQYTSEEISEQVPF